ncbi:hypothetical protein OU997_20030 [Pseudomonas sp. SL4(2022)]|uniref:hypothetical protein n=1 Tax=Pseudomonas sp. SL4(2022) TaxID=2994661 RepID=UPI00226EC670|nr:hypothetical protein [Pseudomonas sp. SL4(2022)]WAC44488.1 hypothetical protein OU997_20030 [Pseudomonas sp. SL4(2022)]
MHVSTSRQTLARKTAAEARVKHRETELSVLGVIECTKKGGVLLKDLVDKYLAKVGHSTRIPVNAWHWENSVS